MWNHEEIPLLCRTGQTVVYRTGDDGSIQAGRPGGNRLRDAGDGTIHDRHTGLLWVKQPELIIPGAPGVHPTNQAQAARGNWANAQAYAKADLAKDAAGGTYWVCAVAHTSAAAPTTFAQDRAANASYWRQSVWTASAANLTSPSVMLWNDAVDNCLALQYAGYDDWRLPNISEMLSISDFSLANPCWPALMPNGVSYGYYWASTTYAASTANAWVIYGVSGSTNVQAKASSSNSIRPVRGGRTNG